ncbi:YppG family protein [Ornithinibacillus sp. 4-3]|uniref:YppG family protein n=1 Tax=Ornithinibacillus sp. 4-3 TaxID=3231488 RepID=A0AB39HN07_9BACI
MFNRPDHTTYFGENQQSSYINPPYRDSQYPPTMPPADYYNEPSQLEGWYSTPPSPNDFMNHSQVPYPYHSFFPGGYPPNQPPIPGQWNAPTQAAYNQPNHSPPSNSSPSFMSQFQQASGQIDFNKMLSTVGQLANTVQQVAPMIQQFSALFKRV